MKRNFILTMTIALLYTKGIYTFTCQTVAKLVDIAMPILNKVKEFAQKLSDHDYSLLVSCIWIVNHLSNKLEGICSISSSVCDNVFCATYRKIKDCICSHCYAHNQQSYQTGLKEHNILNGFILRNVLIPVKAFKALLIIFPYLRIESFGDVANVVQCRNYIRIIKANHTKRCVIFSKNIMLWEKAFEIEGKPKNTTYVHSSKKVNVREDVSNYDFVDHVFTVYTKRFAKENNIVINCGGKKCMKCILEKKNCFFKVSKNNDTYFINELLK